MKNFVIYLTALLPFASSGQTSLLMNVDSRKSQDLNGPWHYLVDRYNTGLFNFHMKVRTDGYFMDRVAESPDQLVEYGFDKAPTMHIPGDWNTADTTLYYYEGAVWFQRDFEFDGDTSKSDQYLWFGAANYLSHVWLNGELLGEHEGGFTAFNYLLNNSLRQGKNSIVVRVENERKEDRIPTINTDWWNYGGITRDVKLISVPKEHIVDYKVQLKKDQMNVISGHVQLSQKGHARLLIEELKIDLPLTTDNQGLAKFEIETAPTLWTPLTPKLYEVKVSVQQETLVDQIGFRTVATDGHDILLNGKATHLRGICIHEEAMNQTGRATSIKEAIELLTLVKSMNCNYVRLAHYPHNRNMTHVADSLGLMVWSEIPVYWTVQFDQEAVYKKAEQQLKEMISRDQNRASIVIWSMANETPLGDARTEFLGRLANQSRALDNTRLVSAALLTHGDPDQPNQIVIDDPLGEYLDVVAINEYVGWYWEKPAKCDEMGVQMKYDKPLIISEFGGGALAGLHGDAAHRWTEEYQEAIYKHQVALFERTPEIAGISPWILVDFRSPRRLLPEIQDGWNRKGVVAPNGDKKKAFNVMKEFYSSW